LKSKATSQEKHLHQTLVFDRPLMISTIDSAKLLRLENDINNHSGLSYFLLWILEK